MNSNRRYKNIFSRMGDLLISKGLITDEQLKEALKYQKEKDIKLGKALIDLGFIDKYTLLRVLATQLNVEIATEDMFFNIDPGVVNYVPYDVAKKYHVIPLRYNSNKNLLYLATEHPEDILLIEDLKSLLGVNIVPVLADADDISENIERIYSEIEKVKQINLESDELEIQSGGEDETELEEALSDEEQTPAIKLLNYILQEAIKRNATDIHIEPFERILKVRFRIDGKLMDVITPLKKLQSALTSRIKILSRMNIAEKRVPQDGRFSFKHQNNNVDIRVSTLPTRYGEKVVMRVLNKSTGLLDVKKIGISPNVFTAFNNNLKKPYGIILVSGPTGSGKTTTLYAILNEIKSNDKNIITIEDPIEYDLEGVNQVQINEKAGLLFSTGLRAILRQDPDIIMVGEIRDAETAEIAVRSALTGHLVISTIHANDAASTVTRLIDMGIPPYLVGSSLIMVVAQRLIRKICTNCKKQLDLDAETVARYGLKPNTILYTGQGCNLCNNTGYSGRTAIFEIMTINKALRKLIFAAEDSDVLKEAAIKNGMLTLRDDGIEKVKAGISTLEEIDSITFLED